MKYTYKYLEDEWTRGYWNFIQQNINKDLDWVILSSNRNITWDILKNNLDKDWDCKYMRLSINPNITWDIIQNNPDEEWCWVEYIKKSKYNMGYNTK